MEKMAKKEGRKKKQESHNFFELNAKLIKKEGSYQNRKVWGEK